MRNWSCARNLICAAYQSGRSPSSTTFSTCHTGSVQITWSASRISSSKNSLGSTRGWRAIATPLTWRSSMTTRSTGVDSRRSPPAACEGVREVGPHAVPALAGPAGVGRGAPLGEVHLADEEVVAGGVVPPVVGHALEDGDELEEVDDALVVGVLVEPLAQRAVVPPVELVPLGVQQRLDDLLQLALAARVAVPDRAPAIVLVVPDGHLGRDLAVLQRLADVLEDLRQPRARVLDEVAADVDGEPLVGHRHAPPAQVRRALEQAHALALDGEQRRRRQPRRTGSDDHDVVLRHEGPPVYQTTVRERGKGAGSGSSGMMPRWRPLPSSAGSPR